MVHGRVRSGDIRQAEPLSGEQVLGRLAHYGIGAGLGVGYGRLAERWRRPLTTSTGCAVYGLATTGFSWFVMFPAWGLGVGARRRGDARLAALSAANHVVFGVGLGAARTVLVRVGAVVR
jgi:hypothetical protein